MRNILVEYDGSYPTTCMGRLKIFIDNILIYNQEYCCKSVGGAWNEDYEVVEEDVLVWEIPKVWHRIKEIESTMKRGSEEQQVMWDAELEKLYRMDSNDSSFDEEIQQAVAAKLSEFSVCCGGCK